MTRSIRLPHPVDTANSQIIWEDVSSIERAQTSPAANLTISGNTIHYPAGLAIDWVWAYALPTPTRCDGPGRCSVNLQGSRTFTASP